MAGKTTKKARSASSVSSGGLRGEKRTHGASQEVVDRFDRTGETVIQPEQRRYGEKRIRGASQEISKELRSKKPIEKYIEGIGRRKTASARVRLTPATERTITVNGKSLTDYFHSPALEQTVFSVFDSDAAAPQYAVSARVAGGGIRAHADAIRLGIARALVKEDQTRRAALKQAGFLKRDPRSKERRKFGLKKARKAPQWSKR